MRILGFGTYRASSHPRVAVLIEGLTRAGHTVRELNEPLRANTKDRVAALNSAAGAVSFFRQLGGSWIRLIRGARAFRGAGRPDALLVGYLGHFDVILARLLFPRTPIILDHLIYAADTAKDRGATSSLLGRGLEMLDRIAHACATIVVYDTPAHAAMAPAGQEHKGVVVPVGAPDAWYRAGEKAAHVAHGGNADGSASSGRGSVVFYGLFTPLQGTPTIARALRLLHERGELPPVTLIGSGQDEDEVREILRDTPVTWHPWVEPDELPDLVAVHPISLGIVGTTAKAGRVVPNKVYQSMAAGCAVITSDTPSQREILGEAVCYVPAGDSEALADAIADLAGDGEELDRMRHAARHRAEQLTPERVIEPLAERL